MMRNAASRLVLAILAAGLAGPRPALAADAGVAGKVLVLDERGERARLFFEVENDPRIAKGPAGRPADLEGTLEVYYSDAPGTLRGVWTLPSPWKKNKRRAASYINREAPGGPTTVHKLKLRVGKSLSIDARGLGDGGRVASLTAGAPSETGGVSVVLTIRNAADGSTHRLCTRFADAAGSRVKLHASPRHTLLKARGGVPSVCPAALTLTNENECEVLNDAECLLPYPSSRFLVPADTPTGVRLALPQVGMPPVNGQPVPTEMFDGLDGFSPGVQILMHFPQGVDPERSNAARLLEAECCGQPPGPPWIDTRTYTDRSLDADSPSVLLDADTGERLLHFIEPDARAVDVPARQLLFLRPARLLVPGHRYVVAMRRLVGRSGDPVVAEPAFAALRDGVPTTVPAIESRREQMEDIFAILEAHGVERDDLVLAFDFVVRSDHQLTHEMLSMRDQALAWLDTVEANPAGKSFTVTDVTENTCGGSQVVWRYVTGTFASPLFLTGDLDPDGPQFLNLDAGGTPVQNGFTHPEFTISIPCSVLDPGVVSRPILLGHGLFQTGDFLTTAVPPVVSIVVPWTGIAGATDWRGLSGKDLAWVGQHVLGLGESQLHNFPTLPARLRQGMLNTLVLARMMKVGLFNRDPAFQTPDGHGVLPGPEEELVYWGISLGGIMGTYLAGLTPDIERFGLDVPAVNFSCLLQRATPFVAFDALVRGIGVTDPIHVALGVGLTHELWVSGEPASVAPHITADPLAGTNGPKRVLMAAAWLDKQVSNTCTEIAARTLGLPVLEGSIQQGLQDIPDLPGPLDSALIFWDLGELDILNPAHAPFIPPLANLFPSDVCDPHPRRPLIPAAIRQLVTFLQPGGRIENFCDGLCDAGTVEERTTAPCTP